MPREFIDGDRVGHEATAAIDQFDAVTLTGERQVAPTDTIDDQIWGIAMNSAEVGEHITVVQHGEYEANVGDAVAVNDLLSPNGTNAGQLKTYDSAGGDSEQLKHVRAVQDLDEADRMLIYIS